MQHKGVDPGLLVDRRADSSPTILSMQADYRVLTIASIARKVERQEHVANQPLFYRNYPRLQSRVYDAGDVSLDGLFLQRDEGEGKVRIVARQQLTDGAIPGGKRSQQAKDTTGFDAGGATDVFSNGESEKGEVEGEEEEDEGDRVAKDGDEHEKGEDEPTKEEKGEGGVQFFCVCAIGRDDAKAWDEDDGIGEPETTVRGCE